MMEKRKSKTYERLTASKLRENIYQVLDQVLLTGEPVEIYRHGQTLRIEPPRIASVKRSKLLSLPKRDLVIGDEADLIHMDWSPYWKP